MFPSTLTVSPGTTVTFTMSHNSRDFHTATFGPKSYLMALAAALRGGPTFSSIATYPSDPAQPIALSPSSHGNGFGSTGFLDLDPSTPLPGSAQIKFTKPGSYRFVCLVHPQMRGTVTVK